MANIPLQSITFPGLSDKYTTPTVDATLTQAGAAADAKKTGDELAGLKNDLIQYISNDLKTALLQIASKVTYIDGDGQTYYDDLYSALYPPEPALYPMVNGTHAFTAGVANGCSVEITNHKHVKYLNPNAGSGTTGIYVVVDDVAANGTEANAANISQTTPVLFTFPQGKTVEFSVKNIVYNGVSGTSGVMKYAMAVRHGNTSVLSTGDLSPTSTSKTVTDTISNNTDINCIMMYAGANVASLEFDVEVLVDGQVWV